MTVNWLIVPTVAAAGLLFVVGQWSVRRCRSPRCRAVVSTLSFLLGIPGFLIALYYLHWFDNAKWFYEFRSMPLAELTAAGAGLAAGALSAMTEGKRRISRPFLVTILCLGIVAPYLKPVVAPVDTHRLVDRWRDNVCLQSTESSCGAASAATVFRDIGLQVTEPELAHECFTYRGGTENWYIVRAFRRRGCSVNYRIESGLPHNLRMPSIAGVRVGGVGHFIALLDRTDDVYVTGDPLVGRQEVPASEITNTFEFTGFFMEIQRANKASEATSEPAPGAASSSPQG